MKMSAHKSASVTPNSNLTERLIIVEAFVEAVRLNDERCEMHVRRGFFRIGCHVSVKFFHR